MNGRRTEGGQQVPSPPKATWSRSTTMMPIIEQRDKEAEQELRSAASHQNTAGRTSRMTASLGSRLGLRSSAHGQPAEANRAQASEKLPGGRHWRSCCASAISCAYAR